MPIEDEGELTVAVPQEFFAELLPRARDLAALKVALHVMHLAEQSGRRGVRTADLYHPEIIQSAIGLESPRPAAERLRRAVDSAVADGLLLKLAIDGEEYVFPGTAGNRAVLARVRAGDPGANEQLDLPAHIRVTVHRPNAFSLYEQHIGPLTPLIAEQIRQAERAYPRVWIERAIEQAVAYDGRSWRYIESILGEWERRGAPD